MKKSTRITSTQQMNTLLKGDLAVFLVGTGVLNNPTLTRWDDLATGDVVFEWEAGPTKCCGCICHVCDQGHASGVHVESCLASAEMRWSDVNAKGDSNGG